MGKYICPYCGESERFLILTDEDDELHVAYDREVRCGTCFKLFNDQLSLEIAKQNKLQNCSAISNSRRRRPNSLSCFEPEEVFVARKSRCTDDYQLAAKQYTHAASVCPNNWEAVFFDAYYTAIQNTPAENVMYYKIFASKIPLVVHLAESVLSGEELVLAIEEICNSCTALCLSVFYRDFQTISKAFLSGEYRGLGRMLMTMDTTLIYDILFNCLCGNYDQYRRLMSKVREDGDCYGGSLFAQAKRDFVKQIKPEQFELLYRYPQIYQHDSIPFLERIK